MTHDAATPQILGAGPRPMRARDPHEHGRTASPLELLYDLTLVVAFGVAGSELAHALAAGHVLSGLAGFAFIQFGAVWAWVSYTWFAACYDTDDVWVRLAVIAQMVGVLLMALGTPKIFAGFEHGWNLDNSVVVAGYVVMRLSLILLYVRALRANPDRRRPLMRSLVGTVVLQVLWIGSTFVHHITPAWLVAGIALYAAELALPVWVDRASGGSTWNAHHLAERFSLLALIALGESVIGTTAALEALISAEGWSVEVAVLLGTGVSLTVGLWWIYFGLPLSHFLARDRTRLWPFVFSHFFMYASIAAVGAGLHVAAYEVQHHNKLGLTGAVAAIAVPVTTFLLLTYLVWQLVTREGHLDPFHLFMVVLTVVVGAVPVVMAAAGLPLVWCIGACILGPWISVVGMETYGRHHAQRLLDRI